MLTVVTVDGAADTNRFCAVVGCRRPIQQAAMGAVTTPALAGAVAAAGGLGMIAAAGLAPAGADAELRAALERADGGRVGVNFLMPFLDPRAVGAVATHAAVVEFFYGDPDPALVDTGHAGGALVAWQVGSVPEAMAAVEAGCDLVVAQGVEAGGHVRGTTPRRDLVRALRPRIDVPIVAAGGIGSRGAVRQARDDGADAVRVGTRFLATREADAHPAYVDALIAADADDTVLTTTFSAGWPDAPHRVLRACVDDRDTGHDRSPFPPTGAYTGDVSTAALYAGTSVTDVRDRTTAAELVAELGSW
jgi:NAD(P)H-dependent flavin oxidoreductase YrpB (nitropropane dioxygenase family)